MKKHDTLIEICKVLGIDYTSPDISTGSTITKTGVLKIFIEIARLQVEKKNKQDVFKDICQLMDITIKEEFFSTGSTISAEGYEKILETL